MTFAVFTDVTVGLVAVFVCDICRLHRCHCLVQLLFLFVTFAVFTDVNAGLVAVFVCYICYLTDVTVLLLFSFVTFAVLLMSLSCCCF